MLIKATPAFQLDEERFVYYADNLLQGFYAPHDTLFLWNGPGLPFLLVPLRVLGWPLLLAKLLNAVFLAGTVWCFRKSLETLGQGDGNEGTGKGEGTGEGGQSHAGSLHASRWAWAIGLYLLLFGFSWLHLLMTECLAAFCVALLIYAWVLALKATTPRQHLGALSLGAAAFGYLALTRFFFGYMLLAGILFGGGLWLLFRLFQFNGFLFSVAKILTLTSAGGFIFCAPYLTYTYQLTGRFFYWGNTGGSQLYTLTAPEKNLLGDVFPLDMIESHPEVSPSTFALLQDMARSPQAANEVWRDERFRQAALENVRRYPRKVFQNWRANVNRLIFDYPFSRFPGSHSRQGTGNLAFIFSAWFYALMASLGFFVWRLAFASRQHPWRLQPHQDLSLPGMALGFALVALAGLSLLSAYARFVFPLLPAMGLFISEAWRPRTHAGASPAPRSGVSDKPRLLVEALAATNDSGLGRHVRLMVQAMAGLHEHYDVHVLWPRGLACEWQNNLHVHPVRPRSMRLWIELAMPWHRWRLQADAVLHLGYTVPSWPSQVPSLLLVPDAGPLEPADTMGLRMSYHTARNREAMRKQLPRASRILVSTDFTAKRLKALSAISKDGHPAISILPPFGAYTQTWAEPNREHPEPLAPLPEQMAAGFIVCVGNVEPRKNHVGLLRAYAWLLEHAGAADMAAPPALVCVGHEAWDGGETRALAQELHIAERVIFTGHVSDAQLAVYLRDALYFVTASLYEGFGMPLFEAMCLGKACIYHQGTSHDDFAFDAAIGVDATRPEVLGQAMLELWRNEPMRRDYEMKAKAKARQALSFDMQAGLREAIAKATPARANDP